MLRFAALQISIQLEAGMWQRADRLGYDEAIAFAVQVSAADLSALGAGGPKGGQATGST
ncbi:hypothetical protein GCM10007937_08440 [Mesorhizobium albiziae]|nr:hypothetical protein GCM10007937_08440 [Mesorhizobium albiziae]